MSIAVGAAITGIVSRTVQYMEGGTVIKNLYFRDVTFAMVGLPEGVPPVSFMIAVNDATQWDTLQVGQTCTITITPPGG